MGLGIPAPELRFGAVLLALLAVMWLGGRAGASSGRSLAAGRALGLAIVYATLYAVFLAPPAATLSLCSLLGVAAANEIIAGFASGRADRPGAVARFTTFLAAAAAPWLLTRPAALGVPALWLLMGLVLVASIAALAGSRRRRTLAAAACAFLAVAALDGLAVLRLLPDGGRLCLFAFFVINVADTAAYFCGKLFGRRKLAPSISPGKTVEGSLGSLVVTIGFAFLFNALLELRFAASQVFVAGILLNLLGQAGDLLASLLKRRLGLKDFGTLLGGHGGVLDRFDSCLLAVPGFVLWLKAVR